MRILQLIQKPQLRGAEIFACQLSSHLVALGHEVKVICLFAGDAALPFGGEIINLNRPIGKRMFDLEGWKSLANEIQKFKPDIIQANAGDTLKFSVLSKIFFRWRAPIVFRNANKVSDLITSRAVWLFNKFLISNVDYVISVSELCRLNFIETYKSDDKFVEAIPIGIEIGQPEAPLGEDIKHHFSSTKVLLNVSSLVPEKNHEALLRIVHKLVEEKHPVRALIVGGGRLQHEIEKCILSMNLQNHVFLLGYRTDISAMMKKSDVFIMPSRTEGLPGVILESFYNELPVVAFNVGGISEAVLPEKTGWLVEANNEKVFSESVKNVLSASEKVNQIKQNAYEFVTSNFWNKNIAERFLRAYQKILS